MKPSTGCEPQSDHQALFGLEGELVMLRITVEPRNLEDALEALASLDFPVNPELIHRPAAVVIEFPAYRNNVGEVEQELERQAVAVEAFDVFGVLNLPEFARN